MGGVRGDVISLGFLRTTILEMGQPEGDDDASVPMWVQARQYTGRVVTVTNAAVFDEPVYNYSRDFPFIWEELHLPVKHDVDLDLVERLLREAVDKHAMHSAEIPDLLHQLRRRYFVPAREVSVEPEVFYTLTSNWIECAIRFVVPTHDIRRIKSNITRDLVSALAAHDVPVASTTYAVVDAPPITLASAHRPAPAYPNEPDAAPSRRTRAANGRAAKRPRS
jgi:small-conductance mechanosensitive channel